jgi:hypothetical protein
MSLPLTEMKGLKKFLETETIDELNTDYHLLLLKKNLNIKDSEDLLAKLKVLVLILL